MSPTDPFRVRADPDAGPWQVLAAGDKTGGTVVFGEARLPPRTSGPHLHVHSREDEAAYFASLSGPPDENVVDEIGARYGVRRVGPPLTGASTA